MSAPTGMNFLLARNSLELIRSSIPKVLRASASELRAAASGCALDDPMRHSYEDLHVDLQLLSTLLEGTSNDLSNSIAIEVGLRAAAVREHLMHRIPRWLENHELKSALDKLIPESMAELFACVGARVAVESDSKAELYLAKNQLSQSQRDQSLLKSQLTTLRSQLSKNHRYLLSAILAITILIVSFAGLMIFNYLGLIKLPAKS